MPLYEYECSECHKKLEIVSSMNACPPECCGKPMVRKYGGGHIKIKRGDELFIGRMSDIHKAQEQRGERLRFIQPKEVVR